MFKRVAILMFICVAAAQTAAADSIVTWQSSGHIGFTRYVGFYATGPTPPTGTPFQLTMMFDPSSIRPTSFAPPGAGCNTVPMTGSLDLGGVVFGLSGMGFTHAQLPGNTCTPGSLSTEMLFSTVSDPSGSPWPFLNSGFLELGYAELLARDTFPAVPTTNIPFFLQMRDQETTFLLQGDGDLRAVGDEQPSPVPEPGTLTLFGLGLAAGAPKLRRVL